MADDLVVREWNCGGWLTTEEQCITIYEPREYLPLGRAIGEHNALARAYLERDAQLAEARVRRYGQRRAAGSDHTTACSIWGDDGQGNAEGFSGPLICNCGALENFYQAQLAAMTAARDAEKQTFEATYRALVETNDLIVSLEAQLTASEAALRKYGRHEAGCASLHYVRPITLDPCPCSCGLDAGLAEPGKAGEP